MRKEKNERKEFQKLNIEHYQSTDLKSFLKWFGIFDLCKDFCKILLFVRAHL